MFVATVAITLLGSSITSPRLCWVAAALTLLFRSYYSALQ